MARVRCLLAGARGIADLREAADAIDRLALDGEPHARICAELLRSALELVVRDRAAEDQTVTLGGLPLVESALRVGLERTYRALAAVAATAAERIELVDEANRVRPRTWT
jgi:serine/threonine-protein kinase PknG